MLDIVHTGSIDNKVDLAIYQRPLPEGIINLLAQDKISVRVLLAQCAQSMPNELLVLLANDIDLEVRGQLAFNSNNATILDKLRRDSNPDVRHIAEGSIRHWGVV